MAPQLYWNPQNPVMDVRTGVLQREFLRWVNDVTKYIGLAAYTGSITASGLTMPTDRLLGRTTAGTGSVETITVGSGLNLSAGTLTATSSASAPDYVTTFLFMGS